MSKPVIPWSADERLGLVDICRNIRSSAHGAREFVAGIDAHPYADAYAESNDKPLSHVEEHVSLRPMLAMLSLLAAMALPQDVVSADPIPGMLPNGMLPNGVGADEVAISAITDAAVQRCVQFFERELAPQAGMRIDRRAMTSSPNLGQIWRADAVSMSKPVRASRFVCTNAGKSIEPLDGAGAE